MEPLLKKSMEVNIVNAVVNGAKFILGFNNTASQAVVEGNTPLTFLAVKDVDGNARLRFMAVVSNNFKDRENEIIPEAAHQEYVAWATKENVYPELWLWHAGPASRWGQADWLDVSDGFLVASGLVDKGYEYIAHNLEARAKAGDPSGVSHGFLCAKSGGHIGPYRTFELSPLPFKAAANEWTGFSTFSGENMAFTQQKREWLKTVGGISDEAISTLEQATSSVAKSLKDRGIEYKDMGADVLATADEKAAEPKKALSPLDAAIAAIVGMKAADAAPPKAPEVEGAKLPPHAPIQKPQPGAGADQKPDQTHPEPQAGGETKAVAVAVGELSSKEYKALDERIGGIETAVAANTQEVKSLVEQFQAAITKLSKSDDEKTAAFFAAKASGMVQGHRASESNVNTNAPLIAQFMSEQKAVEQNSWFHKEVLGGLEIK